MKKAIYFWIVFFLWGVNGYGQNAGDFRTISGGIFGAGGNWNDASIWQVYDGASWIAASGNSAANGDEYPGQTLSSLPNVTILENVEVKLNGNYRVNDLTIDLGGKLYVGSSTSRFVHIYGDLINNGQIGEVNGSDGISFSFEKQGTSTISGDGIFHAQRFMKGITAVTTNLIINTDVNLHRSLTAMYNAMDGSNFNVTISAGKTANIVQGSVAIDGIAGEDAGENGGKITVDGSLYVAKSLYLTTNNTSLPCSLQVNDGATVRCSTAVAAANGSAGQFFFLQRGGEIDVLSGNLGLSSSARNTVYELNGTVVYSGSDQNISPAAYTTLSLEGSGTKTFGGNTTITKELMIKGTTIVAGGNYINFAGAGKITYFGDEIQITGSELHNSSGLNGIKVNNLSGVILSRSVTIPGDIEIALGNLKTNASVLTFGGTITESDGNTVLGYLKSVKSPGTSANTFGNIGFEISAGSQDLGQVSVTRITGDNAVVSVGANNSIKRRFIVTADGTDESREITFRWFPDEDNGKGPNDVTIFKYTGGSWSAIGIPANVGGSPRILTQTSPAVNGSFTVSDINNPLPVELTSFSAEKTDDGILLSWITASEIDNYGFEVQKAPDAAEQNWETIGFVKGAGTSNSRNDYYFTDKNLTAGKIFYRLKQINSDGSFEYLSKTNIDIAAPKEFKLYQNYPNPFNPSTKIKYSLPEKSEVTITIYDILGNKVSELVNGNKESGTYEVVFSASRAERRLASGTYIYRIQAGKYSASRKFLLLK